MQTIKVPVGSDLADAVMNHGDPAVFFCVKTSAGETIYRGVLNAWTARVERGGELGQTLTMKLEDWDKHWGEIAARKHWV